MNNLTDRSFWEKYWENYQYQKIPQKMFFDKYIPSEINDGKSFIEIGGFPGTMSIYFHKKFGFNVSLLDFYIDKEMVHKLERTNNIKEGTINWIESDFFVFESDKKYDFVFSFGFIEHFENTKDVVNRHVDLLDKNGYLLIILPNFRGLNGWIQKKFDRKNFEAHNLNSMVIKNLSNIMTELAVNDIKIEYTKKPMIWLEPKPTLGNKIARVFVKTFSLFLKLFPFKGRFLSPYIVVNAHK